MGRGRHDSGEPERNLVIEGLKEICCVDKVYDQNGVDVLIKIHVYEVIVHSGEMKNNEPHKHTEQKFLPVDEIMKIPYLSDCTLFFLESLGLKREVRI